MLELAGASVRKASVMGPGDVGAKDLHEATAVAGGGAVDDVHGAPGRL